MNNSKISIIKKVLKLRIINLYMSIFLIFLIAATYSFSSNNNNWEYDALQHHGNLSIPQLQEKYEEIKLSRKIRTEFHKINMMNLEHEDTRNQLDFNNRRRILEIHREEQQIENYLLMQRLNYLSQHNVTVTQFQNLRLQDEKFEDENSDEESSSSDSNDTTCIIL